MGGGLSDEGVGKNEKVVVSFEREKKSGSRWWKKKNDTVDYRRSGEKR